MVEQLSGRPKALAGLREMAPADITTRRTLTAQKIKVQRIKANA